MAVDWTRSFEDLMIKTSSPYTLIRDSSGGVLDENGRYNSPPKTESTIQAHIQPAKGIELQDLPEGRHGRDTIKIYTVTELKTVDETAKTQPDQIVYLGKKYQVDLVKIRNVVYKALATRIER
jgi:hypothetical protein